MGAKKKLKLDNLAAEADPRAPLDSATLLAAVTPVLARLEADLRARVEASPAVRRALEARYQTEKTGQRTADTFAGWTGALATQVAAAWVLSCVFVRTLEDRGLLKQARLAGPGALDSQRLFFQLAPSLTERDYLLMVFRELSHHPAAGALFDAEHSLVWKLSPSAGAAKELLALFRTPSADAPALRFGQSSTRFLGDLYQDLSEEARKRFALLQTPDFIESFILDRTLEPAIQRFGLDDTTLIDPTCGSGHFLLGAFDRLFEHRVRNEPGLDPRVAAHKSLDAVHGADINPYAVAVARFRLTLAYLDKAGYRKLSDAPALPLHLAVADSLLHNPHRKQTDLAERAPSASPWHGDLFALEDEGAARDVLFRQYAAVVGNPPYITEKDPARREVYRSMYVAAAGKYALSAPFCERFFQLARPRGYVGQITSNAFMKREFGKKLIEDYLPTVNLDIIINISGADIPGHTTPTVLLFGSQEPPHGHDVLATLAKRGDPSTPDDPAKGRVWLTVAAHWQAVGYDDDYISVARIERTSLQKHPWSLGGGGASELKELLEEKADKRLGEVCKIGVFGMINADECMIMSGSEWSRTPVEPTFLRKIAIGEHIRDWTWRTDLTSLYPYHWPSTLVRENEAPGLFKYLWPFRTTLAARATFGGGTYRTDGLPWWKWHQVTADRVMGRTITFAFVATHNHFVLDQGGKVFGRSAPIIKLPDSATENDFLALVAYLNSSIACFWMKQVFYPKATSNGDISVEKGKREANRYEFAGTGMLDLPLPTWSESQRLELARLAREALDLAEKRSLASSEKVIELVATGGLSRAGALAEAESEQEHLTQRLVAIQEDIDWLAYTAWGLTKDGGQGVERASADSRPFNATQDMVLPSAWRSRVEAIAQVPSIRLMEDADFKRPWLGRRGVFGHSVMSPDEAADAAARAWAQKSMERIVAATPETITLQAVVVALRADEGLSRVSLEFWGDETQLRAVLAEVDAVPFVGSLRYSDTGFTKWEQWLACWDAQRLEDSGSTADAPSEVPPKYLPTDFLEPLFFRLRGKLDVPTEAFISYPGCESDKDGEPVFGWAGWDHLQRARALAALYMARKDGEGWRKERLTPMLAGLLELLPWVKQWHNEPSEEFGGLRMGEYFENFLEGECRQLGLSQDDLRAWRPEKKRKASKTKPAAASDDAGDLPPKKRASRKKKVEPTVPHE